MKKRMSGALSVLLTCAMLLGLMGTLHTAAANGYDPAEDYEICGTLADGSYVVSAFNVKDYGAVGDGVHDDTAAIKAALEEMRLTCRAGIVYFPSGTYRITEPGFSIEQGVTVLGETMPGMEAAGKESLIVCDFDASHPSSVFLLKSGSTLSGLSFYYPKQRIDAPLAYPATLSVVGTGDYLTVRDVLLYNSYDGMDVTGGGQHVANVGGTVLHTGLRIGSNAEVSEFMNIDFSASYWSDHDGTDRAQIAAYTKKNATGLEIGYADELFIYQVSCPAAEFYRGLYFYLQQDMRDMGNSGIAYGNVYKIADTEVSYSSNYGYDEWWPDLKLLDDVPGTQAYDFDEPQNRYSTKSTLYNVRAFGAVGDGVHDDTLAFRRALEQARVEGGGIVFLPAGRYLISGKLELPQNTELLGEAVGYRDYSPSVICVNYQGEGEDDYLIGLSRGSGVQGVQFYLPLHDPKTYLLPDAADYDYANGKSYDVYNDEFPIDEMELTPYPYLIRGKGNSVWVENVGIVNGWNGVDFSSERCDHFVVRSLWGSCMNQGLTIGGGSENGQLSCVWFTYGSWWKYISRSVELSHYSYYAAKAVRLGDCSHIRGLSVGCFGLSEAVAFVSENGGQPENISIVRLVADMPFGSVAVRLASGDRISILGASTGLNSLPNIRKNATALTASGSMTGKAYIYGQNIWGNTKNVLQKNTVLYTEISQKAETLDHDFSFGAYDTTFSVDPPPDYQAPEHPEGILENEGVSFNRNAGAEYTYDEASGVFTVRKGGALAASLDSVEAQTGARKTDFSHPYIRYSYRFLEQYEEPGGAADWLMYFTLRNSSGYLPMWASDYAAYIIVYRSRIEVAVYHDGAKVVTKSLRLGGSIVEEENGAFVLKDTDWHTISLYIDDQAKTITLVRDGGTEAEKSLTVSTVVNGKDVLMPSGGYSFGFYHADMQVGDFAFENTSPEQTSTEPPKEEPVPPAQGEEPSQGEEPTQEEEPTVDPNDGEIETPNRGPYVVIAVITAVAVAAVVVVLLLLRKKKQAK